MSDRSSIARGRALGAVVALTFALGCEARDLPQEPPAFDDDVAAILQRCAPCHSGETPAAGYRTGSYLEVISCVEPSGEVAVLPASSAAPILRALDDANHVGVLDGGERSTLEAWVTSGARARRGSAHRPGIIDPRSADFHGKLLREQRWAPMLDAQDDGACGRCHAGPARPDGIVASATGATDCTSCHEIGEGTSFGCTTCHGSGELPYAPRDACFFPSRGADAHAAHLRPSRYSARTLDCTSCHPARDSDVRTGGHGDGTLDVVLDPAVAGEEARYDPDSGACTHGCHAGEGAAREFRWRSPGTTECGDCHGSPPEGHYPGTCDRCHSEVTADGQLLDNPILHLDGTVQHGDGRDSCSSCHGMDTGGWPSTGAHAEHRSPTMTTPLECGSCHRVPVDIHDAGHLDGEVAVVFGGRALARGATPSYDRGSETCTGVACHGANLSSDLRATPRWISRLGNPPRCGACHAVPPRPPHTSSTQCGSLTCHGSEVAPSYLGPRISDLGRDRHIDGDLDVEGGTP